MPHMLVAFEVSQPETSREAKVEQPMNVPCMLSTLDVSHSETSAEASDLQP